MTPPVLMAALGVASCAALIGVQFVIAGPVVGLLLGAPLAAALWAFARRRRRGVGAASLLLVFYVALWLVEARAGRDCALAATMLAATAFCSALLFARAQAAADRRASHGPAES